MEHLIKTAIFSLTGLEPEEKNLPEEYCLMLGSINPIIIRYDESKRKSHTLEDLRYSALIEILEVICKMIGKEKKFITWAKTEGENQ